MNAAHREQSLLAAFVLLVLILPFSHRAVYMDEHLYLGLAQSALTQPLYPQDMPWLYFGTWFANAADHTHPPLGEYHLGILFKLLGHFSEASFRILFAVPYAILAVLGFYGLAARWVSSPFWVSLLFAACPPFFVMAPTLMMDLPSLGCLLMGMRLFLSSENRLLRLAAACLLLTCALGMAYTVAIPLFALTLWCFLERKSVAEKTAVTVPFLVLGLWLILMTIHFGEFPLRSTLQYALSQFKPGHNLAAAFSFTGGLAVFPWTFAVLRKADRKLLAMAFICAIVPVWWFMWPSKFGAILYLVMASWGAALILRLAAAVLELSAPMERDRLFLLAWFFLSFLFVVFAADMMTARYLLLYLPPLYLIVFANTSIGTLRRVLVPTVALSLCLAIADYRLVGAYRTWVSENVPAWKANGYRIWSATESGLRFYLEEHGVQELDSRDLRPRATDLVIEHSNLFRYSLADDLATMLIEVKQFDIRDWFPIRTFNSSAGAGFHDSRVGLIPFTFSTASLDAIDVAQVSPFAARLPVQTRARGTDLPVWTPAGVELRQTASRATFEIPELQSVEWAGELVGSGMVEFGPRSITLRLPDGSPAVWRNFRIVPKGLKQ